VKEAVMIVNTANTKKTESTAYLKDNPSAYQAEIVEHFACDISTACRTLKRLKITHKKR
jgi:transposase